MTRTVRQLVASAWLGMATVGAVVLLAILVLAALGVVSPPTISRVEEKVELSADGRRFICDRVNELPARIARLVALLDERERITGPTTSTPTLLDLTPEERAQLDRIRAELTEIFHDLGTPIDCEAAAFGTTTPNQGTRP